jgi:hypothetical protein
MDKFRSPEGLVDGETWTRWEKYSTMGNGFTFELETLLFLALALHVCGCLGLETKNVSVFGDDVIIPKKAYPLFKELSTLIGFTVNSKKSHADDRFRESCGVHYYEQCDTKPLYIKTDRPISSLFLNWLTVSSISVAVGLMSMGAIFVFAVYGSTLYSGFQRILDSLAPPSSAILYSRPILMRHAPSVQNTESKATVSEYSEEDPQNIREGLRMPGSLRE